MSLKKYKTRYCPEANCSRELEKYQRVCSECAEIRKQISLDCANHTYRQTEKYYVSLAKTNQRKQESGYFRAYEKTENRKKYRLAYEQKEERKEYKREWQRRKNADKRTNRKSA